MGPWLFLFFSNAQTCLTASCERWFWDTVHDGKGNLISNWQPHLQSQVNLVQWDIKSDCYQLIPEKKEKEKREDRRERERKEGTHFNEELYRERSSCNSCRKRASLLTDSPHKDTGPIAHVHELLRPHPPPSPHHKSLCHFPSNLSDQISTVKT